MKTTTAFAALTANRKARLNVGNCTVRSMTKKGVPSKVASREVNGQEVFTREQAEVFMARLAKLNPTYTFVIVEA